MSDILCVSNRKLAPDDFFIRLERIARAKPKGIILREKDLEEEEYRKLADRALAICRKEGVACLLHSYPGPALDLGADGLHLPLPLLRRLSEADRTRLPLLGASCHSVEEALEAEDLGCSYVTAGHIFETACKAGLPGRGLDFLEGICRAVSLPVYAIGGLSPELLGPVQDRGAAGICLMSSLMTCPDPEAYLTGR